MTPALFTRFTSTQPLAKLISKGSDGSIVKKASAQMHAGRFETLRLDAASPGAAGRLVAMLQDFRPTQALSPSLSLGADAGEVVTQKTLARHPGAVARDARHFGYRVGAAGLLVLDFDPAKGLSVPKPDELWLTLLQLWPEVADGIAVHWHSAGAFIFDGDRELIGIGGQRFYLATASQADIPRALAVLNKRAWLRGLGGHVHVSASGSLLPRGLFDSAMGDKGGRLDFAPAGAVCGDGLEQRRGPPTVFADGSLLDTRATLPDLSAAEEGEVAALIEAAKVRAEPLAEARRATWLAERQQGAAVAAVKAGADPDEARQRVAREHTALLSGVLMGSAELVHVNEEGAEVAVTVDRLLADPQHWHGKAFLSPHDPEHRGRSPDAMAYLLQATPTLYDLNDSVVYRLQAQPVRLQVLQGNRAQLADQVATEMAQRADLFNSAGHLVRTTADEFAEVTRPMLSFMIGTRCALYRQTKEGKASAVDIDQQTADMVHALLTDRARKVKGRSSIPLIDAEGRVIQKPGLDDATGIYLDLDADEEPILDDPSRDEVIEALRRAWAPFSLYEWATPHDRAAMLATVLTVPLRPTIDAAPGLFVDSASQGSGKSSAAAAILALSQGHRGNVKSWTGDSERELEQYLLSLAKSGASAVAWDNVLGTFDSAVISTSVIEGRVSARQLGATRALSPTFRTMWLASGTNGALGRDCGTRFLQARIACPDGQPHRKSFPFEPSEAALADRMGIARAIVTIHCAWHQCGRPSPDRINTRFPAWGRTVRQLVLWLAESGIAKEARIGELGDPADSILNRASTSDPDTEASAALLAALHDNFEAQPFTASDVGSAVRIGRESAHGSRAALWEAVAGFFPRQNSAPTTQSLSSLLRHRKDRIYEGLKLLMLPKPPTREGARSGQLFAVVEVAQ